MKFLKVSGFNPKLVQRIKRVNFILEEIMFNIQKKYYILY
jgi:hypothetical protein